MNRNLIRMVGTILLVGAAMLVVLPACGGSAGATTPSPATPQSTATNQPTPTSVPVDTAPSVPTPLQSAVPPSTPAVTPIASAGGGDLLAQGKVIFEKTAGGVGCAYCHGLDGNGKGTPDIRGAAEARVRNAIVGGVPAMSFIKLSEAELLAVVAYLQYLNQQPQEEALK